MTDEIPDPWFEWLTKNRHGGDEAWRHDLLRDRLIPLRDRILDRAVISTGHAVLDVGSGDGLIAFGALDRVGDTGSVIFSDVSSELLDLCRRYATDTGVISRCRFIQADAGNLSTVADESVDAVTMRAVLIYVKNKRASLVEFHRVLRPGGWLVISEPINRFIVGDRKNLFAGYDVSPVASIAAKIEAFYDSIQDPIEDPMMDFDERDLMNLVVAAGFHEVHIEYNADIEPRINPQPWDRFAATSGNPLIPTLDEAMDRCLGPQEMSEFIGHLQPLVEQGIGTWRMAGLLLWARRD